MWCRFIFVKKFNLFICGCWYSITHSLSRYCFVFAINLQLKCIPHVEKCYLLTTDTMINPMFVEIHVSSAVPSRQTCGEILKLAFSLQNKDNVTLLESISSNGFLCCVVIPLLFIVQSNELPQPSLCELSINMQNILRHRYFN